MASKSVPFPENPSNGERFTYENTGFQWWSDWGKWISNEVSAKEVTPHSYNNVGICTWSVIPFPENPSNEQVFSYKSMSWRYYKDWNIWSKLKS